MTPTLSPYVVPISVVILLLLFAVQSRGTEAVSKFFGPIMALWFIVLAIAVAGLLGAVSGAYPANRAARLDPIQALHHE